MTAVDVERFRRTGFLTIDRIAGPDTIARLGDVYDAMLDGRIDCRATDNPLGMVTRQIMIPRTYDPIFRDNEALTNARAVATALLDAEPVFAFDMLIFKPPGHTAETPWHQDFAYAAMPFTRPGAAIPFDAVLQFWVALDDVDETTGCMQFIPGIHTGAAEAASRGRRCARLQPAPARDHRAG